MKSLSPIRTLNHGGFVSSTEIQLLRIIKRVFWRVVFLILIIKAHLRFELSFGSIDRRLHFLGVLLKEASADLGLPFRSTEMSMVSSLWFSTNSVGNSSFLILRSTRKLLGGIEMGGGTLEIDEGDDMGEIGDGTSTSMVLVSSFTGNEVTVTISSKISVSLLASAFRGYSSIAGSAETLAEEGVEEAVEGGVFSEQELLFSPGISVFGGHLSFCHLATSSWIS